MTYNISFYIAKNRTDKKGHVPIYAQITIKSKNYPFQIEKIKERYWNYSKQRVKKNRENEPYNRHEEINSFLDRLSKDCSRFERFRIYKNAPNRIEVKNTLFNIDPEKKSFDVAYEEFLIYTEKNKAYNTLRGRKTARNFIKKYADHFSVELQYSDINLQFFDNLYDFAFEELDLEDNAFASYVAKFKSFMKWAKKQKYHGNDAYKEFSFSEKNKNVICLTPDEFKALYNLKIEEGRLDKARDLYCFSCLTGLRYSDMKTLNRAHIKGDIIQKNIKKTTEYDSIPLLPQALEILNKYNNESFRPLPIISNQKLNDYIKECCELAEINAPTVKISYRRNKISEAVFPKHQLITVHTARKTFITIGFMMGLDVKIIKSITGHKKDATFDKYLKIADDFKKEKLLNAWNNL
ncbi:site-specific integrase [Carboxylicivirga sp. RSCT41]|uniref:site-specific integrase n=1 Tax=Carboxylicivirga agarovorans TaxID=3417570 RepID=UPI003D356E04